jgi:hypothetical protein
VALGHASLGFARDELRRSARLTLPAERRAGAGKAKSSTGDELAESMLFSLGAVYASGSEEPELAVPMGSRDTFDPLGAGLSASEASFPVGLTGIPIMPWCCGAQRQVTNLKRACR